MEGECKWYNDHLILSGLLEISQRIGPLPYELSNSHANQFSSSYIGFSWLKVDSEESKREVMGKSSNH